MIYYCSESVDSRDAQYPNPQAYHAHDIEQCAVGQQTRRGGESRLSATQLK